MSSEPEGPVNETAVRSGLDRFASIRGLMYERPLKKRINLFCVLLVLAVALCFTPAGLFSVAASVVSHHGFLVCLALVPVIGGALLLGILPGIVLGGALGVAILIHATIMPASYIDCYYAYPLTAIVPMVCAVLVAGILFALAQRRLLKGSYWSMALSVIAICAVASLFYCLSEYLCLALTLPSLIDTTPLKATVSTALRSDRVLQMLVCTAILSAVCVPTTIAYRRKCAGLWSRGMRTVFRRWLFVYVGLAFIVTVSVTYVAETMRCQKVAASTLDSEIVYLKQQIDDHESRAAQLTAIENQLVLDKANTTAGIIAQNPSVLDDTTSVKRLADLVGLSSLTVTDADGTIIADSDGAGIGIYNFGAYEQTRPYLNLISGSTKSIVEEPRASIDEQGIQSDAYLLYAGVARSDASGLIQVSIPASDFNKALSAVSIEHLADGYTIGNAGGVVIINEGTIVTATRSEMCGASLVDYFDFEDSDFDSDEMITIYDEDSQITYFARLASSKGYQLIDYLPLSEAYADRARVMIWDTELYLVLFMVVFLLASRLLSTVVVSGIEKTNKTLGRITEGDLSQRVDVRSNREFDSLSDGINTTVDALKDSIAEASARIDRELATARAIQSSALPQTFPPFPEISDFDIYASMNPAREVGGDFYDFFLIDDDHLGLVIADVSGKGIPAALFMMTAKTEIQNCMLSATDLALAITTVNRHLCLGNDAEMFVTAFIAVFDFHTGEMTYVNAGHNPPLLRHNGQWGWLRDKSGLFLGAMDEQVYRAFTRKLEHTDELVLYTDGVTEAWDSLEEIYGEHRLLGFLNSHMNLHPKQLVGQLKSNIMAFAEGVVQADDITILALEYGTPPEIIGSITVPARVDQLNAILGFVHGELARRLCPLREQKQLDIAIEELFVNVASYAYPDADESSPGTVEISYAYRATPSCITIELTDQGIPFDPLARDDPQRPESIDKASIGGLGIMMARKCTDDMAYRYEDGRNIISFSKHW